MTIDAPEGSTRAPATVYGLGFRVPGSVRPLEDHLGAEVRHRPACAEEERAGRACVTNKFNK